MDAPTCKICGQAHWPREEHRFEQESRQAERVTKPVTKVAPTVTKDVTKIPSVTKGVTKLGRPKTHASAAAKQAAYLKRKTLQPYQQRVVDELAQLDMRYAKLGDFMRSDGYEMLAAAEKGRLGRQVVAMKAYGMILQERIDAWGNAGPRA